MPGTDLSRRLSAADTNLWVAWAEALRGLPDNPFGVEVERFGRTTALLAHAAPTSFFNRVLGLSASDLNLVPDIMGFYRERQTPCRIDLPPREALSVLLERLDRLGWRESDSQANLFGRPDVHVEPAPDTPKVIEIDPSRSDAFANLYDEAYHGADHGHPLLASFRRASITARIGRPGWHGFIALVDGIPAAGGILHVVDSIGTLSGAATLPRFRGRGCQSALLQARIAYAADRGCDLIVSRCRVGSISQRNMERAGLRLAYVKAIFEQVGPDVQSMTVGGSSVITAA